MSAERNGRVSSILYDQAARAAMLRGIDTMAALLRPTLGPVPRTVAITQIVNARLAPEVLDSAATIARRTIQIPGRFENIGAMLVRDLACKVFERVGDGAATAAVIAQALAHEGNRYVAAGWSPMRLKHGIEHALPIALAELEAQARPIDGADEIAALVAGSLRDDRLAAIVGEIVDSVGPDGAAVVESTQAGETSYQYVDGLRWEGGLASAHFFEAESALARVLEPRLLVTDLTIESGEQLVPAVEACVAAGQPALAVIAPEIKEPALALLLLNRERGVLSGALALHLASIGGQQGGILRDIAVFTGGRCLAKDQGDRLEQVGLEDLGSARQVWATRHELGILGGRGTKEAIRQRVVALRAELAESDEPYGRRKLRERIGKLSGTAAVILVGAPSETARDELRERVEAAFTSARLALEQGVVPGGGAGLLACARAVERLELTGDEALGARLLVRALAEPMRVIAANAGREPEAMLHEARQRGAGWAFDVAAGRWVEAREVGLVDPLAVQRAAFEAGVSGGLMALTTEVLVLPPDRDQKPSRR